MSRGRQYYDPIIQVPATVESAATRRIELYPEQDVRDNTITLRWVGRLVDETGRVIDKAAGSFDHDGALRQAQELWPGLEVFELREESEDSTWEGMGPSPRLWQGQQIPDRLSADRSEARGTVILQPGAYDRNLSEYVPPAVEEVRPGDYNVVHAVSVPLAGNYVLLDDVCLTLEYYARQFDADSNPSAALGLRQAADALREAFDGNSNP